jgi:oligoendopeptidase F
VAKLHFFRVPLYYIEYGIAQLGALQLWRNYRRDPAEAVRGYRRGLTLGGGKPLPELFRAAGLSLTLDSKGIEPLVADVESVLTA